jgi:hypothetical protein
VKKVAPLGRDGMQLFRGHFDYGMCFRDPAPLYRDSQPSIGGCPSARPNQHVFLIFCLECAVHLLDILGNFSSFGSIKIFQPDIDNSVNLGLLASNLKKPKDCQWIGLFKNSKIGERNQFFPLAYIECHLEYSKLVEVVVGKS